MLVLGGVLVLASSTSTMDWRCSHVDKNKPPTNHIMVVYCNVEAMDMGC